MNMDIEKFSYEYLEKQIDAIKVEIDSKKNIVFSEYSLKDFEKLGENEIVSIFESFGFDDALLCAKKIKRAITPGRFSLVGSDFSELFTKNFSNERSTIDNIIGALNSRIIKAREEQEEQLNSLNYLLTLYQDLFNYLYSDVQIVENDYEKIKQLILNLSLSDDDKVKLSYLVSKRIIEKNKQSVMLKNETIISAFEQQIDDVIRSGDTHLEQQYINLDEETEVGYVEEDVLQLQGISLDEYTEFLDFANSMLEKYGSNNGKFGYVLLESDYGFENVNDFMPMTISEMEEVIDSEGFTLDNFSLILSGMIANVVQKKNLIKESYLELQKLDNVYMLYSVNKVAISENLRYVIDKIATLCSLASTDKNISDNFWKELAEIQNQVNEVEKKDKIDDFIYDDKYKDMCSTVNKIKENVLNLESKYILDHKGRESDFSKNILMKSFVLFDGVNMDSSECLPYIVADLNENNQHCLIDHKIISGVGFSEENDYRVQMSKLICDLLVLDNPEFLRNSIGSTKTKKTNTVDEIFALNHRTNEVDRSRSTGMYRIRPTTNSVVRFAEQKVVLHKDTEIFRQVISIIRKYLPNVEISENEDFSLYVNFGAAAKYSDEDLYEVAMSRYGISKYGNINRNALGSSIMKLFYENGEYIKVPNKALRLKERLNGQECMILEQIIANCINTYDELKKLSNLYDFEIVNQMRGVKQYGLQ